jgi:CheY-like chemotaxis protein
MNSAQIILIEDNPADVLLVEMALKENNIPCQLIRFANGEEALSVLCGTDTADSFQPDAILLDLNTPRSDGFQVLIKLKEHPRFADVPIAIITSSKASSDKQRTSLEGTRYVEKPLQLQDFLTTIGRAVKEMLVHP